jgi:hydrogenase expression/formation protein HypE
MSHSPQFLPAGKIKSKVLASLLEKYCSSKGDERVILGSQIGEDAAVIDMGERYLIAKSDPITFLDYQQGFYNKIGYWAVNVNINDIATCGGVPKWFQATVLLPEHKTTENLIEEIFKDIHTTCKNFGIIVVGGHTEVSTRLSKPLVIGCLLGEVEKEKLVKTSGAQAGDAIILTKGIVIEGTSIIAQEKEKELLKKGFDNDYLEKCKQFIYDPGISVLKEALIANQNFKIHSMHDPTEGGLACGLFEVAYGSQNGVLIDYDSIKIFPESKELCKEYGLNPLGTISSGSLLIILDKDDAHNLVKLLGENGIFASIIGTVVKKEEGLKILEDGKKTTLHYSETDEITKIF